MANRVAKPRSAQLAVCCLLFTAAVEAAAPPPRPAPPTPGRPSATIDLTGYWVPVISQDWRWRMLTPPKGDYASVPLNDAGRKLADTWDLAKDNAAGDQCKAFGAPAILRVPGRLHISWVDDRTLKMEFDAGSQVRLLHFDSPDSDAAASHGERSLQGYSQASWFKQQEKRGFRPFIDPDETSGPAGSLVVHTDNLKAGYLRKNGVPYSERATLTEYFDRFAIPDAGEWLEITAVVDDPTYLRQRFIVATHFRREAKPDKWNPTPCQTDLPVAKSPLKGDNF